MSKYKFISQSETETISFATKIAKHLKGGDIVCLFGNLGSGKTTFVKGLASAFGVNPNKVNSPTFTLINEYKTKKSELDIYHFDLYRLNSTDEINDIGYDEYLYGNGISVIEWAERFGALIPSEYLRIELKHYKEQSRAIECIAIGKRYEKIVNKLISKNK